MSTYLDTIENLLDKRVEQDMHAVKELRGLLAYMEKIEELTVTETYVFHGILTALAFTGDLELEEFSHYAKILGNYDNGTIQEWWLHPHHIFTTFIE